MNIRILTFLGSLFIVAASLTACKKEIKNDYGPDATRGYYPLIRGHYVTYDVDSILWNDYTRTVTPKHSQVRYTVVDTFTDLTKKLSYRIDVNYREADTSIWRIHSTFYATPEENALDVTHSNLRIRKLIFPVIDKNTWNGNAFVPTSDGDFQYYNGWNYRYEDVQQPYNNGRAYFENTISVPQADAKTGNPEIDSFNYADRVFSKEIYAFNVGLVYKELTHWVYDRNISTQKFYRSGFQVVMRAIDHN